MNDTSIKWETIWEWEPAGVGGVKRESEGDMSHYIP
jgi:hypothetical protein